ncbi:hypothetical protein FRC10_009637 [Ceratobasidium sp. 414]|nr:hypothetical protein FRC10_009637 [Ceratobasidium sp. 414]
MDIAASRTRDTRYYIDDGNVILLVEDVLFRVFGDMLQLPKPPGEQASSQIEGLSDDNPITIPQVKASAFRHLLLLLYGLITDRVYQALVTEVTDDKQRTITAFRSYLDISSLAHRFCMLEIEKWALNQFRRVLASPIRMAELPWVHGELLDALAYTKLLDDPEMVLEVRNFIGCHLQMPRARSSRSWGLFSKQATASAINTLKCLYKDDTLKTIDPALFGLVFCSVLSEGHTSSLWTALTLEDRSKLLAAQVYLTPLPLAKVHLSWIKNPAEVPSALKKEDCATCFQKCSDQFVATTFPYIFDAAYVERLQANTPLTGILALRELPKRRRDLSQLFQTPWGCEKDCGGHLLRALDCKIDSVFTELCHSYHDKIR